MVPQGGAAPVQRCAGWGDAPSERQAESDKLTPDSEVLCLGLCCSPIPAVTDSRVDSLGMRAARPFHAMKVIPGFPGVFC